MHTLDCHTVKLVAVMVANKLPVLETLRAIMGSSDGIITSSTGSRCSSELCALASW
jgi:hypothetical protein